MYKGNDIVLFRDFCLYGEEGAPQAFPELPKSVQNALGAIIDDLDKLKVYPDELSYILLHKARRRFQGCMVRCPSRNDLATRDGMAAGDWLVTSFALSLLSLAPPVSSCVVGVVSC